MDLVHLALGFIDVVGVVRAIHLALVAVINAAAIVAVAVVSICCRHILVATAFIEIKGVRF
jgi:hypothetical protein